MNFIQSFFFIIGVLSAVAILSGLVVAHFAKKYAGTRENIKDQW